VIDTPQLLAQNLLLSLRPEHLAVIEAAKRGAKDLGSGDVQELYAALFYTLWHSYYHQGSRCVVVCKNAEERLHIYMTITKWICGDDLLPKITKWQAFSLVWLGTTGHHLKLVLPTHRLALKPRADIFYLVTDGGDVTDSNEALKDAPNILRVWRKKVN
jgi:hypothetical protein